MLRQAQHKFKIIDVSSCPGKPSSKGLPCGIHEVVRSNYTGRIYYPAIFMRARKFSERLLTEIYVSTWTQDPYLLRDKAGDQGQKADEINVGVFGKEIHECYLKGQAHPMMK